MGAFDPETLQLLRTNRFKRLCGASGLSGRRMKRAGQLELVPAAPRRPSSLTQRVHSGPAELFSAVSHVRYLSGLYVLQLRFGGKLDISFCFGQETTLCLSLDFGAFFLPV